MVLHFGLLPPVTKTGRPLDDQILAVIAGSLAPSSLSARSIAALIQSAGFRNIARTVGEWSTFGPDVVGLPHPNDPSKLLTKQSVLTSLEWHALKHSVLGAEWPKGTTAEQYLRDVRAGIGDPKSDVDVGLDDGSDEKAAVTSPRPNTIPSGSLANLARNTMFTVYSPRIGRILTSFLCTRSSAENKLSKWAQRVRIP